MRRLVTLIAAAAAATVRSTSVRTEVTLRASHQFPGSKGDVRDEMVQIIAKEAAAANVGLNIEVYPDAARDEALPVK